MRSYLFIGLCLAVSILAEENKAAEQHEDHAVGRIAFGSCLRRPAGAEILGKIMDYKPDLFVWLGDNIYVDARNLLFQPRGEYPSSPCICKGKRGLIPSKTRKKKREVRIPIQEDLLKFLESAPSSESGKENSVFPTLASISVGARHGLSKEFIKIMRDAGVDRGKPSHVIQDGESKGKGNVTYERGFHSLRHTFTTWLREAKVPEEDRMALTGHSTRESHAGYSHEDEEALKSAIEKLPSIS